VPDTPNLERLLRQFEGQLDGFDPTGWKIVAQHRNPWGRVPVTGGGQSLDGGSREYMDRLLDTLLRNYTVMKCIH
jgi:hypothetical protein